MSANKDSQEDKQIKVKNWDASACKNAIDDMVKDVLKVQFKYDECYRLIDGRLVICGVAVVIALFALLWDYLYPFPQSRPILIFCVASYFFLMGILTLYTTYKEKGIFVVATQKDAKGNGPGNVWEASSYMAKFDDQYSLTLNYKDKNGKIHETSITRSVANFIDEDGVVLSEPIVLEVVKLHNSLLSDKKDK